MGFSLIFDQQNQSHNNSPFWNEVIFGMFLLNPKHGLQWCRLGKLESFQITHILIVTILFKSRNDPVIPPCSPSWPNHTLLIVKYHGFFSGKITTVEFKRRVCGTPSNRNHLPRVPILSILLKFWENDWIQQGNQPFHEDRMTSFIVDSCWHLPEQQWFWDTPTCPSFLVTSCRGRFEMWNVERLNQRLLTAQIYCVHSRLLLPTS
jgi:hypothetical protein